MALQKRVAGNEGFRCWWEMLGRGGQDLGGGSPGLSPRSGPAKILDTWKMFKQGWELPVQAGLALGRGMAAQTGRAAIRPAFPWPPRPRLSHPRHVPGGVSTKKKRSWNAVWCAATPRPDPYSTEMPSPLQQKELRKYSFCSRRPASPACHRLVGTWDEVQEG